MIWNNEVLFLHTPKTAGMSMTALLTKYLKDTVNVTEPGYPQRTVINGINYLPGKRHENLFDAESFFTYRNKSIKDFKKIFVVMRNPYDLELSRYYYLRKGNDVDKGPAQDLALKLSFSDYLPKAPFFGQNPPRLDKYFHMNGYIPDNLLIIRYENLVADLKTKLLPYLQSEIIDIEHQNKSRRKSVEEVYDYELEKVCYKRNRWFFDKGFYSRITFD